VAAAAVEGTDMAPTEATTNSARKAAASEGRAPAQRVAVQGGQSCCQYQNTISPSAMFALGGVTTC